MKTINQYIQEKFIINKNTKVLNDNIIKSPVDNKYPNIYNGTNFIFNSQRWPNGHFTFIMEYVKNVLDECQLSIDDHNFVQGIYDDFKKLKKWSWGNNQDKIKLINGEKPEFHRAKFFYDMFNWVLKTKELTIPRKQKINKIMTTDGVGMDHEIIDSNIHQRTTYNIKGLSWPE